MQLFRFKKKTLLDDASIIAEYKATGKKDLVGVLFEKYAHLIYGVCFHYLKDEDACSDAVMNIFEKLFSDLKKYEIQNFSSWLHSTARNYCFAYIKKQSIIVPLDEKSEADEQLYDNEALEDELIAKHIHSLNEAIDAIKDDQRVCIKLFYLGNKSYEEISQTTGFTFKQVKSHIQNGKRNLKIYLTEKYERNNSEGR